VNPWSSLDPWTTLILVATLKLNQVFSSEMRIITGILLLFFFAFLAVVPVEAGPQSGAPFW
jgi:positive regulator of sigma E activity